MKEETTRDPCPVCGGGMFDIDYIRTGDGDEMRVDSCAECGWPPTVPYSVEAWRSEWEAKSDEWERFRA